MMEMLLGLTHRRDDRLERAHVCDFRSRTALVAIFLVSAHSGGSNLEAVLLLIKYLDAHLRLVLQVGLEATARWGGTGLTSSTSYVCSARHIRG